MDILPVHVDPLDRAILDWLCSIPATWRDHSAVDLTATGEQALWLMEQAGLVERRATLYATMDGQPDAVEMVVVVSGEEATRLIWKRLFSTMPSWVDGDDQTKGRVRLEVITVQIRLSDQGELARHEYEQQTPENPSVVCAFVRRRGFYATRPAVTPTFRVETCRVDSGPTIKQELAINTIAASQASVGDITINNVIQMDESVIVARIIDEIQKRGVTISDTQSGGPSSGRNTGSGAPPSSGLPIDIVIRRAEQHVKAHKGAYPGRNKLAKIIGCSPASITKATERSTYLKARKAEHEAAKGARKGSGREVQLRSSMDEIASGSEDDSEERDATIDQLIAEQQAEQRREERQRLAAKRRPNSDRS